MKFTSISEEASKTPPNDRDFQGPRPCGPSCLCCCFCCFRCCLCCCCCSRLLLGGRPFPPLFLTFQNVCAAECCCCCFGPSMLTSSPLLAKSQRPILMKFTGVKKPGENSKRLLGPTFVLLCCFRCCLFCLCKFAAAFAAVFHVSN